MGWNDCGAAYEGIELQLWWPGFLVYDKTKMACSHFWEEYEYIHWKVQPRGLNTNIWRVVMDKCRKNKRFEFFFPVIFSIFQNVCMYVYYFCSQVNALEEWRCWGTKRFLHSGKSLSVGGYENGPEDILPSQCDFGRHQFFKKKKKNTPHYPAVRTKHRNLL